jgi:RHS repeat-associated protein
MGYFTNDSLQSQKRTSAIFPDTPKTHTPGSRLQGLGLRYYSPMLGSWLSRDPIGENVGECLYGFVVNRPSDSVDEIGLQFCFWGIICYPIGQPIPKPEPEPPKPRNPEPKPEPKPTPVVPEPPVEGIGPREPGEELPPGIEPIKRVKSTVDAATCMKLSRTPTKECGGNEWEDTCVACCELKHGLNRFRKDGCIYDCRNDGIWQGWEEEKKKEKK